MSEWLVTPWREAVRLPRATPPVWATRVPRWEQLDPASAAITWAWFGWGTALPDVFLLANQAASNQADLAFARAGAYSPAKFVATLPSVTLSALLQATGWVGPMICVQNGARTLISAFGEAALLAASGGGQTVGIMTYDLGLPADAAERSPVIVVRYFALQSRGSRARASEGEGLLLRQGGLGEPPVSTDDALIDWLEPPGIPSIMRLALDRDLTLERPKL